MTVGAVGDPDVEVRVDRGPRRIVGFIDENGLPMKIDAARRLRVRVAGHRKVARDLLHRHGLNLRNRPPIEVVAVRNPHIIVGLLRAPEDEIALGIEGHPRRLLNARIFSRGQGKGSFYARAAILIDERVTVIVDPIAALRRAGMNRRMSVIAIRSRLATYAIAIAIGIRPEGTGGRNVAP